MKSSVNAFAKRLAALVLTILMITGLCSCSVSTTDNSTKKLSVVTTIFPEYDWVRQIAGDKISDIDLTLLLDNGIDLHSFQPTAQDIIKISSCDVFVYVGGESDEWVEDALKEAVNKNMQVVNLLELLGDNVVEEEIVEGMQAEDEESEDCEEETEYDEHVWLSLKNARILVTGIAEAMGKADPDNAETYKTNAESYKNKLLDLDIQYASVAGSSNKNTVLFGDRFPFRYLTDDYGLNYYAAFVGCSAETEASFETIIFLSGKIDELGLNTVLVIEGADHSIAKTIIENTKAKDQEILVMDSMQSLTSADSAKGVTYISVMEQNLEVLRKALA